MSSTHSATPHVRDLSAPHVPTTVLGPRGHSTVPVSRDKCVLRVCRRATKGTDPYAVTRRRSSVGVSPARIVLQAPTERPTTGQRFCSGHCLTNSTPMPRRNTPPLHENQGNPHEAGGIGWRTGGSDRGKTDRLLLALAGTGRAGRIGFEDGWQLEKRLVFT